MRRAFSVAVTFVLFGASLSTSTAAAAPAPPDLSIYWGNTSAGSDIISSDPADQTVKQNIQPGAMKRFDVLIHNQSGDIRTYRFLGSESSSDLFSVAYISSEGDVTEQVLAGEYEVTIKASHTSHLLISVTASASADTGDSGTVELGGSNVEGGGSDVVGASVRVPPLRVWGVDYRGRFRCEASFPRRTLQPGNETGVTFKITNLSETKRRLRGPGSLKFRDDKGQDLWETVPFGGIITQEIGPGETVKLFGLDARVRWSGPLLVRPACEGLRLKMPWVALGVAAPGAPESDQAAVDAAVAIPGSPFQSCSPGADGEPTTGVFEPPDGADLPPLTIRCKAEIRNENGFTVVALNLVSPQDGPDHTITEEPSIIFGEPPPGDGNFLALRWSFVVTSNSVIPYISLSVSRAVSDDRFSPSYSLEDGVWSRDGKSRCGYEGYSWGGGDSLHIDWVTACGS